jgi:hypothetical protein
MEAARDRGSVRIATHLPHVPPCLIIPESECPRWRLVLRTLPLGAVTVSWVVLVAEDVDEVSAVPTGLDDFVDLFCAGVMGRS